MLIRSALHPFVVFDGEGGGATPPASTATTDPPAETPPPAATTPPPAEPDPGKDAAAARLRREADEQKRRADALQKQLDDKARDDAEKQGEFKRLYEEEKAKREGLEAATTAADQRRNAERSAGDLKFKDPGYALYLLQQDKVDLGDPAAVKTALENLAQKQGDLIQGTAPPPSGGPAGGPNADTPPALTREQLAAMTPQQVAALDPKVLAEALAVKK